MNKTEDFICERGKSICFKIGSVFRKYHKYYDETVGIFENKIATELLRNNINTPEPLGFGFSKDRQMSYTDFRFHRIKKINPYELDSNLLKISIELLDKFPANIYCCESWGNRYLPELYQQIDSGQIKQKAEAKAILDYLKLYPERTFIHGDYSFENIGIDIDSNKIIVFDFIDSCIGIKDWDIAYLLGSIPYEKVPITYLTNHILKMIKLITAIKYIRGLRKNLEVPERKANYEYWWQQN